MAIKKVHAQRPTLGTPIVTGFSQGGMLTFALAVGHPDAVGDALPMAGWLPPQLTPDAPYEPERQVPIRSAHGTADPIVRFEPTRVLIDLLAGLGWNASLKPFEGVEHVMSPEMNAQFEQWLEESLAARAPALVDDGLGEAGPETDDYAPFAPLDDSTIDVMVAEEAAMQDGPAEPTASESDECTDRDESVEGPTGDLPTTDVPATDVPATDMPADVEPGREDSNANEPSDVEPTGDEPRDDEAGANEPTNPNAPTSGESTGDETGQI